MLPSWRKEASAEEAGFYSSHVVHVVMLVLEWNTASTRSGGVLYAPKSLHQLVQSEAARQAEEADRTPLSWCHMVPNAVPVFVLWTFASLGYAWESPMLQLSGSLSRILASLSRPIWCASNVFPEFVLHADDVSRCCFKTLQAVLNVKAVIATGCERRHWLRIVDWISWGDSKVEWRFKPEL